jgi:preprotein translocase subunit SecB
MTNATTLGQDQQSLPLKIERLYVKEISCKLPHAPGLFESQEFKESAGQLSPFIEMNIKTQPIAANRYEVVMHVIINGKAKNLSLFVLEVQQAAIFTIDAPTTQIEQIIKNHCVAFLHPYLSQVVTNTIVQAGFPPIVLQPLQPIIVQQTPINQEKETTVQIQGVLEKATRKPN